MYYTEILHVVHSVPFLSGEALNIQYVQYGAQGRNHAGFLFIVSAHAMSNFGRLVNAVRLLTALLTPLAIF